MPAKRFLEWFKYFEYMAAAAPQDKRPRDGSLPDPPVLTAMSTMALEDMSCRDRAAFLELYGACKTNKERAKCVFAQEEIKEFAKKIAADIFVGSEKKAEKSAKKTLKALEAGDKSMASGKSEDALIWYNKVRLRNLNSRVLELTHYFLSRLFCPALTI